MLSQFLDKLNIRARISDDKPKDKNVSSRNNPKIQPPKTSNTHQTRIVSLSPETTTPSPQLNFRQFSPPATARGYLGKYKQDEPKTFNPEGIIAKRYGEERSPPPNSAPLGKKIA